MNIGRLYIEGDRLHSYMNLCQYFVSADCVEQDVIQQLWNFDKIWAYPSAFELPKQNDEYSVRERAFACLLSLILDRPWSDHRDYIMSIAIVYHGVKLGGLDPDHVLKDFASSTHGEIPELIMSFLNREDVHKSLQAFCLEVVQDDDGNVIGMRMA